MKTNKTVVVAALALLGGAGAAWAQSWGSYDAAFPTRPCHDGWMGCVVDGEHIEPTLRTDGDGMPVAADMRVAWSDLKATAAFSPFVGLSEYTGDAAVAVADPPEGDEVGGDGDGDGSAMVMERDPDALRAEQAAEDAAVEQAARRAAEDEARRQAQAAEQARRAAEEEARRQAQEQEAMRRQAKAAAEAAARAQQAANAAEKERLAREAAEAERRAAQAQAAREAADEAARQAAAEEERRRQAAAEEERRRQEAEEAARLAAEEASRQAEEERRRQAEEAARIAAEEAARKAEEERLAAQQAAGTEEGGDGTAMVEDPAMPEAPVDTGGCADIVAMEPSAMLGKLSGDEVTCLEARMAAAPRMTEKEKISRVLMVNAYSKGDKKTWESLVRRHLDEIDQSDPDLCYKYALHLSRLGPGRASGVIRWANVALENRMVWTADTYTSRVYSLYKLRAAASQALWKKAEEDHATAPSDETSAKVEKYRAMTKVNAREWYEYAKDAGKDTTKALQLCMSAAGTADYCEAG